MKYRGIFINDEWPSFGGWATKQFGGINSKMYAHMFELLLRLKANYLWPAMWASAFNEDDPECPELADRYGIIMGTSHHEPMMRAHKEYTKRRKEVGAWDYSTNKKNLDRFFTEGLERNKAYDNIVTIGMRGDGDVAMGKGDDEENMKTLQEVIKGQRKIIREVYEKSPEEVPQLWPSSPRCNATMTRDSPCPMMCCCCSATTTGDISVAPARKRKRSGKEAWDCIII